MKKAHEEEISSLKANLENDVQKKMEVVLLGLQQSNPSLVIRPNLFAPLLRLHHSIEPTGRDGTLGSHV